jgi:hypothetical protein
MPRTYECLEDCNDKEETACERCLISQRTAVIKKHILSKHSSLLFQKFNELYPDYQTVSPRALSVYLSDEDDGEGVCYYDSLKDDNKVGNFLKLEMNDVESKIIKNILNGNLKIKYDPKLYQCSISEFNIAVENIKNKMSIAGIEGNL